MESQNRDMALEIRQSLPLLSYASYDEALADKHLAMLLVRREEIWAASCMSQENLQRHIKPFSDE
jgi:hypothetical protein